MTRIKNTVDNSHAPLKFWQINLLNKELKTGYGVSEMHGTARRYPGWRSADVVNHQQLYQQKPSLYTIHYKKGWDQRQIWDSFDPFRSNKNITSD